MKALIIVDPQNDFITGSLAVPGAEEIIPVINSIDKSKFDYVIITKDFHPANHTSFKSNSENGIWPDHCVQGDNGSNFHTDLDINIENLYIFKKGTDPEFDSYSGFYDENNTSTGLDEFLKERGVDVVYICGLATDYCVKFTAFDAVKSGYNTILLANAVESIDEDANKHYIEMANKGILIADTQDL